MKTARHWVVFASLAAGMAGARGQQLDVHFSCSAERQDLGEPALFADSGRIKLDGAKIQAFRWESTLYRESHGSDCSIDESDGLQAEPIEARNENVWRITLKDARAARVKRGYDYVHGLNCSIRVAQRGATLAIKPSCPALCGSRPNFSELTLDIKTGVCRYAK